MEFIREIPVDNVRLLDACRISVAPSQTKKLFQKYDKGEKTDLFTLMKKEDLKQNGQTQIDLSLLSKRFIQMVKKRSTPIRHDISGNDNNGTPSRHIDETNEQIGIQI